MILLIFLIASVLARPYDVVVVGAGVSGVTAARNLLNKNVSVLVVEARDRPFGRVWSNSELGFRIDLGAAWIHGLNGNPLNDLARQNQVKFVKTDFINTQVFNLDNGTVIPTTLVLTEMGRFHLSKQIVDANAQQLPSDVPLAGMWQKERRSHTLNPMQSKLWDLNLAIEIELTFNSDLYNLSAKNYDLEEEFSGDHVMFPHGFRQIFDKMLLGMNISYENPVHRIEKGDLYQIHTKKGIFEAKKVLVTVPLGVLKAKTIQFVPELPEWKTRSIDNLGFGLLNKVVLLFPNSPWFGYDLFLTTPLNMSINFPLILNWKKYAGHNALVAFSYGRFAEDLEQKDDATIVSMVYQVVKKCFPSLQPPVKHLITRWGKDPYSRGSYTFLKVNSKLQDLKNLKRNVDGLYFAGESTHEAYLSTVHGAYLSGLEASVELR